MAAEATTAPASAGHEQEPGDSERVPVTAIREFIVAALCAAGLPQADAATVAELMVATDLAGADAHGVFRLPHYVRRLRAGGVNPRPDIRVTQSGAATALVEGDNGMGHLVMAQASRTAVALARDSGMGWVGTRNSNHAGCAGIYAEIPMRAGMIGLMAAVANANHMPIWGGAELLMGTNPIAFAIPAGEEAPVVLDIATTVVSYGTIKAYALAGRDLPQGWMVDRATGAPLTDARRTGEGLLLPVGGYKGSGLALVIGLIAGVLNGAAFGRDVIDFNADLAGATNTGQFVAALDVARFMPLDTFKREVDRHLRDLKGSQLLPGFDEIRLPGERRRQCHTERARDGVPIMSAVLAQLDQLAHDLGIAPLRARTSSSVG
jgi:LDH2 family malate/lactate/ureidoglycolate dehydrogenase